MATGETLRFIWGTLLALSLSLAPIVAQAQDKIKKQTNACLEWWKYICPTNYLLVWNKLISIDLNYYKIWDDRIVWNWNTIKFSWCKKLPNWNTIYLFNWNHSWITAWDDSFDMDSKSLSVVEKSENCNNIPSNVALN